MPVGCGNTAAADAVDGVLLVTAIEGKVTVTGALPAAASASTTAGFTLCCLAVATTSSAPLADVSVSMIVTVDSFVNACAFHGATSHAHKSINQRLATMHSCDECSLPLLLQTLAGTS